METLDEDVDTLQMGMGRSIGLGSWNDHPLAEAQVSMCSTANWHPEQSVVI